VSREIDSIVIIKRLISELYGTLLFELCLPWFERL